MYGFQPTMPYPMYSQRQEIIKVNGENGARAYNMQPNSSALLLDESNPIVWLVQTDGAGYKTVTAYEIKPYAPKAPVDTYDLEARIKRLEDTIYESYSSATASAVRNDKHSSSAKTRNSESSGNVSDDA